MPPKQMRMNSFSQNIGLSTVLHEFSLTSPGWQPK